MPSATAISCTSRLANRLWVDFPRIEHLAAHGQDRLHLLVAAGLGRAAGRVALDKKELVAVQVLALAVRELAGQDGDARLFPLLDLLPGARASLCGLDRQFGDLLGVVRMFVEPQFERVAQHARNERDGVARVQALLGLPLERGVEDAGGEDEADAREDVVGGELDALGQQRVVFGEALDRVEGGLAQPGFVRAAGRRRDQVDVGFARQIAFGAPAQRPGGAGADREVLVAGGGVFLAGEDRRSQVAVELFGEVLLHAVLEAPGLRLAAFDDERDVEPRQQNGLAAQQTFEFSQRDRRGIEELRIGPGADARTASALGRVADALQRFDDRAGRECQLVPAAVACDFDLQPRRQGVGHRDADAVQATREAVRRSAVALVELAAGVQLGEYHFDRRHALDRVDFHRDAATVVLHAHRTVAVQRDGDALAVAAERLVGGVVDGFLDDVQRVVRARVHARTVADGFQSLQDGNGFGGVAHVAGLERQRSALVVARALSNRIVPDDARYENTMPTDLMLR